VGVEHELNFEWGEPTALKYAVLCMMRERTDDRLAGHGDVLKKMSFSIEIAF
jgi:hypothetical protein